MQRCSRDACCLKRKACASDQAMSYLEPPLSFKSPSGLALESVIIWVQGMASVLDSVSSLQAAESAAARNETTLVPRQLDYMEYNAG